MKRVRTGRVVAALVIGALLQVSVAWLLYSARTAFNMPNISAVTLDSVDGWLPPDVETEMGDRTGIERRFSLGEKTWFIEYRSEREDVDQPGINLVRQAFSFEARAGFPFDSFAYAVCNVVNFYERVDESATQTKSPFMSDPRYRTILDEPFTIGKGYFVIGGRPFAPQNIPYRPLPLGFTANTLTYALLVYLGLAGLASLRARRRLRLGLCVGCGYDVRGVGVCPECGLKQE